MPRSSDAEQATVDLVLRYLLACEERRLDDARACLAPDATLTFPGNRRFRDLEEWLSYFRGRVQWVRKRNHQFDVCPAGDDRWVVVCRGELEGVTVSDEPFTGVRFLDRFVVANGQILDQQVWNDLAVHGLARDPR